MDTAIDLFRAGFPVSARGVDHDAASTMRLACPACMERVHLVLRQDATYFAHKLWKKGSPSCPYRVQSWGTSSGAGSKAPREFLPPDTSFQDVLLAAFRLTTPPKTATAEIAEVAARMHAAWLTQNRLVSVADFADAMPVRDQDWTTDEALIRSYVRDDTNVLFSLREDFRTHPGLRTDEHRKTVLLLWRHLHLPQVDDDLRFLLAVGVRVFHFLSLGDLVASGLGVLARIPWSDLSGPPREESCGICHRAFEVLQNGREPSCSDCSRVLCYDCVNYCSSCHDMECERCLNGCPACADAVCMWCTHDDWECASCFEYFCEGGWELPPEEMEKVECEGCGELFCDKCAEWALEDWYGESLCESCREERQEEEEED